MAENGGAIYTELRVRLDKLDQDLKKAESKLGDMENAMDSTADKFTKVGQKMSSVGKTMSLAITAPLAALGAYAVKVGADFAKGMSTVEAVTQATGEEIAKLNDQAKTLGRETQFSAKAASEGMEYLGRAGFTVNEVFGAMPGMLDLAASAAMDLGNAADITSNIMSAFQLEAEESTRVADVLAETAANANTDVEQLGNAMSYVAPMASVLGLSVEETSAAIGLLGNAGIQASKAGTSLRMAFVRMASETDETKKIMKDLNMEFFNSQGEMKALDEIVRELERGLEGMTQKAKAATLTDLFGQRAGPAMMALIGQGADELQRFTEQLENADGAAERMAKTMLDNLGGSITMFKSSLEGAGIAIAEALTPALRAMLDTGTALLNWFSSLDENVQAFIAWTGVMVAALGPLIFILGQMSIAIGALIPVLGTLSGMFLPFLIGGGIIAGFAGIAKAVHDNREAEEELLATTRDLVREYDDLNSKEELSKDQKERLKEVSRDLANLYPTLVSGIDDETEAYELNTDAIRENLRAKNLSARTTDMQDRIKETSDEILRLNREISRTKDSMTTGIGIDKLSVNLANMRRILDDIGLDSIVPEDLDSMEDVFAIEQTEEFKNAMADASADVIERWDELKASAGEYARSVSGERAAIEQLRKQEAELNNVLEARKKILDALEDASVGILSDDELDNRIRAIKIEHGLIQETAEAERDKNDAITKRADLYDEMANKRAQVSLGELEEDTYLAWLNMQKVNKAWEDYPRIRQDIQEEIDQIVEASGDSQAENAGKTVDQIVKAKMREKQALVQLEEEKTSEYKKWLQERMDARDDEGSYLYQPETRADLQSEYNSVVEAERQAQQQVQDIVEQSEFEISQMTQTGLQKRLATINREEAQRIRNLKDATDEEVAIVEEAYDRQRAAVIESYSKQQEALNKTFRQKQELLNMDGEEKELFQVDLEMSDMKERYEEQGLDTTEVVEYYEAEKQRIRDKYAQEEEDARQQWLDKIEVLQAEGLERQLVQLEQKRRDAVAKAEEEGRETAEINQYYTDKKYEIEREYRENVARLEEDLQNEIGKLQGDEFAGEETSIRRQAQQYLEDGAEFVNVVNWLNAQLDNLENERAETARQNARDMAQFQMEQYQMSTEEYLELLDKQLQETEKYSDEWIKIKREEARVLKDEVGEAMEDIADKAEDRYDSEYKRTMFQIEQLELLKEKYEDNLLVVRLINEELDKLRNQDTENSWDKLVANIQGGNWDEVQDQVNEEIKKFGAALVNETVGALEGTAGQIATSIQQIYQAIQIGGDIWAPVAAGFFAIAQESEEFANFMAGLTNAIMQFVEPLIPALDAIFQALEPLLEPLAMIAQIIGEQLAQTLEALAPVIRQMAEIFAQLLEALRPILEVIINVVGTLLEIIAPALEVVGQILEVVAGVIQQIVNVFIAIYNFLFGWLFGEVDSVGGSSTFERNESLNDTDDDDDNEPADTRESTGSMSSRMLDSANAELLILIRSIEEYVGMLYDLQSSGGMRALAQGGSSNDIDLSVVVESGAVQLADGTSLEGAGQDLANQITAQVKETLRDLDLAYGRG